MPSNRQKHNGADHAHVMQRHERYIAAYRSQNPAAIMQFMDKDDFAYSDHGAQRHDLEREEVHGLFKDTFANFDNLEITTLSLHGTKAFTAWEWEISCSRNGEALRLKGCTLMWWNAKDKIIRNHDYVQQG